MTMNKANKWLLYTAYISFHCTQLRFVQLLNEALLLLYRLLFGWFLSFCFVNSLIKSVRPLIL